MSQLAYKKKDLYDDVRACIREGMSIKEAAELCGCNETTVRNWTRDVREVAQRRKRLTDYQIGELKKDYDEGTLTLQEIADKYGYANKMCISQIASREGWEKRKRGRRSVRGGIVSNCIDIHEIEAKNERKAREAEKEITIDSVMQERKNEDMFKTTLISFEGEFMVYTVAPSKKVQFGRNRLSFGELEMGQIDTFVRELLEIKKRFGGGA